MLELAIKKVLNDITNLPVSPIFTIEIPAIVYNVTPITGGVVKQSQVEIKIIHSDYDEALNLRETILKKLDMTVKEPALVSNGITFLSQLVGGGSIFSEGPQCWEVSLILLITWRCL